MKLIQYVLRKLGYLSLLLLVGVMVAWPYAEPKLGHLDKVTLIGILAGVLAGFIAYFDGQLNAILASGIEINHLSLGDAIKEVIGANHWRVKRLRIRALTTEVILPIFRDLTCTIDECTILLHRFHESGPVTHAAGLNARVGDIVECWKALETSKKIGKLEIKFYHDMPHSYSVIIDEIAVINGLYIPNDGSPHGNDYDEPIVFFNRGTPTAKLVKKYISWFDRLFQYPALLDVTVGLESPQRHGDPNPRPSSPRSPRLK